MPVIRRPRLQHPLNFQEVQLERTANFNSVLLQHRPVLPELVTNDRRQDLGDALAALHDVGDPHERLI